MHCGKEQCKLLFDLLIHTQRTNERLLDALDHQRETDVYLISRRAERIKELEDELKQLRRLSER